MCANRSIIFCFEADTKSFMIFLVLNNEERRVNTDQKKKQLQFLYHHYALEQNKICTVITLKGVFLEIAPGMPI